MNFHQRRRVIGLVAVLVVAAGAVYFFLQSRGSDQPAFIGLQIQGMNAEIAKALGMAEVKGVLVRDVALGGPSDRAGLKRGDLIVTFDGSEVTGFDQLLTIVGRTKAERSLPVVVVRGGKQKTLTLETDEWTDPWRIRAASSMDVPQAGLTLMALTGDVRNRFNLPWGVVGVVVSKIDPDSAEKTDLQTGEVIVQVNQTNVWMPEHVAKETRAAKAQGRDKVLLLVRGVAGFRFSLLPIH